MRSRTRLATLLAVVGLALAAPALAHASGEYEPNDTPYTATGPIADGAYSATIETANDQDWYRVDTTQRDVQIQIDDTNDSGCDYCPITLSITDSQGSNLDANDTYAEPQHGHETDHAGYTLREPGTYYLRVDGRAGVPYHFTVSRAGGGPNEPNDRPYTATGPIADGTYSGVIETGNDQDWYRVETTNRDVQISIDNTNDSGCEYCPIVLAITDSQGSNLDATGTYAEPQHGGETAHAAYTLREPGTYYLSVTSNARPSGVPYHFTVSRTAGSPPDPGLGSGGGGFDNGQGSSQACTSARRKVRLAYQAVRSARARYRHHHNRANRRKLNSAKRRLQHALSVRAGAC